MLPVCLKILYRYVTAPHQSVSQTASPQGEALTKARREGNLRYYFTLFQGGENIGKHFVFALSAVHYDEAFFVFPRLL